eukprot:Lithocolla_globosa_v1_NODE_8303_length_837_cov_2.753197.p2 type:complete len:141 gc:universal NODE_8303_length_837_cov_2.753197:287-709(+)
MSRLHSHSHKVICFRMSMELIISFVQKSVLPYILVLVQVGKDHITCPAVPSHNALENLGASSSHLIVAPTLHLLPEPIAIFPFSTYLGCCTYQTGFTVCLDWRTIRSANSLSPGSSHVSKGLYALQAALTIDTNCFSLLM